MFQQPGYIENVSVRLSEALSDIGVDERLVLKKRRAWLLIESMNRKVLHLLDVNGSTYCFGSQSEATTTQGLKSDLDILVCGNGYNVVQDWGDWEPGRRNYLMIQDETVSPGYCLLQQLRDDAPLPYHGVPDQYSFEDRTEKIVLMNTVIMSSPSIASYLEGTRHGPALARQGRPGFSDTDVVPALPCKSWPQQARQWLDKQGVGQWPSDDIRRYCCNTGCFVVGVGSKGSENEELEWRISTSKAERCLMLNLNITQIRCYVLMKMVLKTFIKPHFSDTISSFMCKTVLFHSIANTHSNIWREDKILVCLSLCLFVLYNCILNENCPHFIIPGNNLMRGHISHEYKPYILEILQYIINSEGRALLGIECDDLGARIQLKLSCFVEFKTSDFISGNILENTAGFLVMDIWNCLVLIRSNTYKETVQILLKYIFKLVRVSNQCQRLDKTACCLLARPLSTTLGTVLASHNIQHDNAISAEALTLISLGLNTDVASGKLKLASMLYCIGDTQRTEIVLRDIEESYDLNIVEPICHCYQFIAQAPRRGFIAICDNHNEEAIQYTTALCVKFLPCEINCVPTELKYEMFRSTQGDLVSRGRFDH
ncbi:uncharacterized protein LOC123523789 [Mercenaria mercenaria]|uniref:uncharacterized protein LOC123523789 n=1 Tax=Mercenaria mercenaria TaxID=6596 RepID=UPI00234E92A5|nr:uncharacterized protein LOC123523789 [Mercenaria mercenaria]